MSIVAIRPAVQHYAWGKLGSNSEVANLVSQAACGIVIDEQVPYAELWMGTHKKGESVVVADEVPLSQWLKEHPEAVGDAVSQAFASSSQLPFLFKVLSVEKSLSIQAHPTKEHAEELHRLHPDRYPDPNHKPEMAIALTPFEALCGFRPGAEIKKFFSDVSELRVTIGDDLCRAYEQAPSAENLKRCFTALMTAPQQTVADNLNTLLSRINTVAESGAATTHLQGELLSRLHAQFPADVGCFVGYFLNHMRLEPGQAIFLQANLPHAYLKGDCIECMACSDNVVRAGLTPKFKDVPTLCAMLDYTSKTPLQNMFSGEVAADDVCLTVFDPPVPDFTVARIQVSAASEYQLRAEASGSLLLVVAGRARLTSVSSQMALQPGSVLFVPANTGAHLHDVTDLVMFRAYCKL